jgi:hypothetical protein
MAAKKRPEFRPLLSTLSRRTQVIAALVVRRGDAGLQRRDEVIGIDQYTEERLARLRRQQKGGSR